MGFWHWDGRGHAAPPMPGLIPIYITGTDVKISFYLNAGLNEYQFT